MDGLIFGILRYSPCQLHDHVSLMAEAAVESGLVRAPCHDTHTQQSVTVKKWPLNENTVRCSEMSKVG